MNNLRSGGAKSSSGGFSLVEMATIILISSGVLVSSIFVLQTWMDKSALSETQLRFDTVQQALNTYKTLYGRLPCPASFVAMTSDPLFGREVSPKCGGNNNPNGGDTFTVTGRAGTTDAFGGTIVPPSPIIIGALPVRDLGLPDSYRANTSDFMYTYAVTESEVTIGLNGFAGAIDVVDENDVSLLPRDFNGGSGTATYVIVDHGKDGKGAYIPSSGTSPGKLSATLCRAASPGAPGKDLLNCSFEAGASPSAVTPFAFRSASFSKALGTSSWFDDTVVYSSSLSAKTKFCTTVYSKGPQPSAALAGPGTSTGYNMNGTDAGSGFGIGCFLSPFNYSDTLAFGNSPASPSTVSPTADAYCPTTKKYTVVTGGCTQTSGPPVNSSGTAINAAGTNGPVANVFGGDINSTSPNQLVFPATGHPINGSIQGWECNGSSSGDGTSTPGHSMYTQVYAVCCTE